MRNIRLHGILQDTKMFVKWAIHGYLIPLTSDLFIASEMELSKKCNVNFKLKPQNRKDLGTFLKNKAKYYRLRRNNGKLRELYRPDERRV